MVAKWSIKMFDTASCEVARKYYKRGIYQWNEEVDSTLLGAKAPKPEAVLLRRRAVRKDGHRQFGKTNNGSPERRTNKSNFKEYLL